MSSIKIDMKRVRNENYMLKPIISKLSSVGRSLNLLKWKIEDEIDVDCNARERISDASKEIIEIKENIEKVYDITVECLEQYMRLESDLHKKSDEIM